MQSAFPPLVYGLFFKLFDASELERLPLYHLEPTEIVPASNASEARLKKCSPLRGGGSCGEYCYAIVIIIILIVVGFIIILIVVGFIILAVGGAAYSNNNNNTAARDAVYAGAAILALGILCCLDAICQACQDSCDFCCDCRLTC